MFQVSIGDAVADIPGQAMGFGKHRLEAQAALPLIEDHGQDLQLRNDRAKCFILIRPCGGDANGVGQCPVKPREGGGVFLVGLVCETRCAIPAALAAIPLGPLDVFSSQKRLFATRLEDRPYAGQLDRFSLVLEQRERAHRAAGKQPRVFAPTTPFASIRPDYRSTR